MALWVKQEEKCRSAKMYEFLESGVSLRNGVSSWSSFRCFLISWLSVRFFALRKKLSVSLDILSCIS